MQRPKVLLVFVIAGMVAVAASSAWAQAAPPQPVVKIFDLGGPPTVTLAGLQNTVTQLLPEEAFISGIVRVQGNGLRAGNSGVFMLESAGAPSVSDWLTLTVGPITQDPVGLPYQTVEIDFQSDGAANFDKNVADLSIPVPLPSVVEDGTLQNLSGVNLLNSGYLTIDVESAEEVPDGGATGVLLGLAAVALARFGRRNGR